MTSLSKMRIYDKVREIYPFCVQFKESIFLEY